MLRKITVRKNTFTKPGMCYIATLKSSTRGIVFEQVQEPRTRTIFSHHNVLLSYGFYNDPNCQNPLYFFNNLSNAAILLKQLKMENNIVCCLRYRHDHLYPLHAVMLQSQNSQYSQTYSVFTYHCD